MAKAATAASLALALFPVKSKARRVAAALLGTAGGLCYKFGLFYAGQVSAVDPRATFRLQRAGAGGAAATGRPAVTGPNDQRALG
jgi:hypothetical protein